MSKKQKQRFSDQLRIAIERCGKTRYQICQETNLTQPNLSKFMAGKGGLSVASIDTLCENIGARLVLDSETPKSKGGK